MASRHLQVVTGDAARADALAFAAEAVLERFPDGLFGPGRRAEASVFLVGTVLEQLIRGEPAEPGLERALSELTGFYRPLLQDDVTRRRMSDAVRVLAHAIEPVLARIEWQAGDGELLGTWFEGGLADAHRKQLGQFYTPAAIVNFLLDRALADFDPRAGTAFRVLDPACGTGHFLAPAARRLVDAYRRHREELASLRPGEAWDDDALVQRVFRDHLVGVDLDPFAVRVARIRLRLLALALGAQNPPLPALANGDALAARGIAELSRPFEAIVGNPPYGAQLAPGVARRFLLGHGRFDSTALFIERALELAAEGGTIALVVPHGVTRTGAYAPCRKLLLEKARLRTLLDLGQAFSGVNLEAMAFVAERTEPRSGVLDPERAAARVELWSMRRGGLEQLGDQSLAFYQARAALAIYVPGEVGALVSEIERVATPLAELCRIRRGCAISARDPAIGDRLDGLSPGLPVVRGRDISRYSPLDGLCWLARTTPLFDAHAEAALVEPKVGYQNIASGIVATLLPRGVLPLDTVNVLEPLKDIDALALLGFLNSRLADFYFRVAIANMAQLTVHLDAPTLGSLPVILPDPDTLAGIVRAVLGARRSGAAPSELDALTQVLDDAVFEQVGLKSSQRAEILRQTRPQLDRPTRRKRS